MSFKAFVLKAGICTVLSRRNKSAYSIFYWVLGSGSCLNNERAKTMSCVAVFSSRKNSDLPVALIGRRSIQSRLTATFFYNKKFCDLYSSE